VRSHPHLFEISAWPWLERLSRAEHRDVTLATVPDRYWDRVAADGFDAVFLMGVWRRSPTGRAIARSERSLVAAYDRVLPEWTEADIPGSPYSVQAYEPDERMGGWDGLATARRALGRRHISLILDFVTNHTGFDQRNEFMRDGKMKFLTVNIGYPQTSALPRMSGPFRLNLIRFRGGWLAFVNHLLWFE
jgi:hypothetical protein